jgi:DnaJ-class molecular chaperone
MKDYYYQILGVSKFSNDKDIKNAYRKIAIKYHPDKNIGDKEAEKKFKEAAEAFEVLINPISRSKYDNLQISVQDSEKNKTIVCHYCKNPKTNASNFCEWCGNES